MPLVQRQSNLNPSLLAQPAVHLTTPLHNFEAMVSNLYVQLLMLLNRLTMTAKIVQIVMSVHRLAVKT